MMKKYLFVLCAMLLAGVAYADEMRQTPPPEIFYEMSESCVTIYAVGEGEVLLYDDLGNQVDNPFTLARLIYYEGDFDITVMATAQAEGCLISEPTYMTITVPCLERPVVPPPTFEVVYEDAGVWVYAVGEEPAIDDVWLYLADVGGEAVENPYYLERQNEEYLVNFQAMTIRNGLYDSDWTFYTVAVPALDPLPDLPKPIFTYTEDDNSCTITATCAEPEAIVSMYIVDPYDGSLLAIANPYVLAKAYIEQRFTVRAVAHLDGYNDSENEEYFVVPSFYQQASSPIITGYQDADGYTVTMETTEDCSIYWRYNSSPWDEYYLSEWMVYDGPIHFTVPGHYSIEAYAEGVMLGASHHVSYEFVLDDPTPVSHYDFEEDGIYYNVTGNGTAAVTAHPDYLIGYHDDIVIPSTVTHNGVTYMVTSIEDNAFSDSPYGITSVEIGAYVMTIGKRAFKNCNGLTKVTLGDYVISIGDEAFGDCNGLTSVTIGSGVRNIGSRAFYGCDALTSVICKPAVPPVMADSDCFSCYQSATLHVFPPVLGSYQATDYWNLFTNVVGEDNVSPVAGDVDGNGVLNVSDVVNLINQMMNSR